MKYNTPLFYPYVTKNMQKAAYQALGERIIGQGKTVKEFEDRLSLTLGIKNILSVNNGTAALELAYHLLNLKAGDEVISPVFTCTAANIPLARRGVKIVFADINQNLLIDWADVKKKITKKTKAVVNVHLFDQLSIVPNISVPVVGDAAQFLGKTSGEDFTIYSFQSTKNFTTVDGGALVCKSLENHNHAKLLRWYGIDRETGKDNIDVDITEAGYKYHMNNLTASIGLAALKHFEKTKAKVELIKRKYHIVLKDIPGIMPIGGSPFLIHINNREKLIEKLAKNGIEAGLIHKRNDIYSVFGGKKLPLQNMNELEKTYLLLPCRANMTLKEVDFICSIIKK